MLWASTGAKDPEAPDILYIEALVAPDTINTMPEKTLHAFAEHGQVKGELPTDGGDAEDVLAEFAREGVNDEMLAANLQREGTQSFRQIVERPAGLHRGKKCPRQEGRSSRKDVIVAEQIFKANAFKGWIK